MKKKKQSWIETKDAAGTAHNVPMNRAARRSFKKQTGVTLKPQLKPWKKVT